MPYALLPKNTVFRYRSTIFSFGTDFSSIAAYRAWRILYRPSRGRPARNSFFTTCWVIVEAPWRDEVYWKLASAARTSARRFTPLCFSNPWSSTARTARIT